MKIKVEKFLMKQGNRVGRAAIEFEPSDGSLAGFLLLGFTICDEEKGMFVLFPASIQNRKDSDTEEKQRPYFFLRPQAPDVIERLENEILDIYESMEGGGFNRPRVKQPSAG